MVAARAVAKTLPLAKHLLFDTSDLEEARERVGKVFCPHKLERLRPHCDLDMRQHVARFGKLALSYITYGTDVRIDPGELSTFFLVHLVPAGHAEFRIGKHATLGSRARGAVTSPTTSMRMHWSAECAQLVLKIERAALENHLSHLLGDVAMRPIEFAPELPVEAGHGASLRRLINFVARELDRDETLLASPLGMAGVEQTLMTTLLAAQPSNYSSMLARQTSPATPGHVMRAEELIRSHPDRPISIDDLSAVSGVSARTLFEGFHRFRGTTPMALLRTIRLERAYTDLKTAAPSQSVADIAFKWGIFHLGRFAQDYARRFGELPSATLRKSRHRQ